jgi:hypothetical protein
MSAMSVEVPYPVFTDRDGEPLENGYVWVGVANQNPQTNPIQVYFDRNMTQPAAQPLRTIAGYISNAGTPAQIFVNAFNYSILTQDKNGTQIYNFPDGTGISAVVPASSVSFTGFKGQIGAISDIATNNGSDWIGFLQSGSNAVARSNQDKLRDSVSVKDFGAVGDGITDDTAAFNAAMLAGRFIYIPPGTYVLDNLRMRSGRTLMGSGYETTVIKQKLTGNYAINCLSDATVGQLLGVSIVNLRFEGATNATVAVLNLEANGVYAITHSKFDYLARDTYSPLRMNCPTAGAIYNCEVYVTSDRSATGIRSEGTYNNYDFFITNVTNGLYVDDISTSCVFRKLVTEGAMRIDGQNCVFETLTVENFIGNAQPTVLRVGGSRHSFYNIRMINIPNSKVTNESAIEIYGNQIALDHVLFLVQAPRYPIFLDTNSSGRISNFNRSGTAFILDSYTQGFILRRWTFDGFQNLISAPVTRNGKYTWVNTTATSGTTVTFGPNSTVNDWYDAFVLNVSGTLSTLTITIPQNPVNGQTATISAAGSGSVTTLTLAAGGGKTVVGAPTGLAANSSFTLVYQSSNSTWYRVQ